VFIIKNYVQKLNKCNYYFAQTDSYEHESGVENSLDMLIKEAKQDLEKQKQTIQNNKSSTEPKG
jgi:hypothetical protein